MGDQDLPSPFAVADAASLRGQFLTQLGTWLRLGGALLAVVGGAAVFSESRFAVLAVLGFAVALGGEILLLVRRPERDWYHGRAVAESMRTLGWKYAVGGAPFGSGPCSSQLDARIDAAVRVGRDGLDLTFRAPAATTAMDAIRALPFAQRRELYGRDRIGVQREWYESKAGWNRRQSRRSRLALVAGEAIALVLAAGRAAGAWDLDWSAILAVLLVSAGTWVALKRYEELAVAYGVTLTELGLVAESVRDATEAEWPRVVADAELAISREHTLWLAACADPGHAR
ncbi:DUF4231 domain-containing protein [Cryptosporangium phraense]|uniref:DUF4231 domain-containing protein n=1 Tax=Cryptosporangium phraense TaxID=2593070 RepID=A0A545AN44_9ACTN|nr:DUF4231 domain-containing protein [Cryptosporangium phraense]TQS42690.1 DUF4231 domain-containing protein [Cryptosporangium phraense]